MRGCFADVVRFLLYRPMGDHSLETKVPPENRKVFPVVAQDGIETTSYLFHEEGEYKSKDVLVFMHGVSDTTEMRRRDAGDIRERTGKNVYVVGYRGFCRNSREWPSMRRLVLDGTASVSALKEEVKGDAIFYGQSIGAGVAIQVAKIHRPKKLILEAPVVSMESVLRNVLGVWEGLYTVSWKAIGKTAFLSKKTSPVLKTLLFWFLWPKTTN
ncbi:MAG: alpha/beta hydrolase family protein [Amphiamblys sp. WSBS2006]|nr:MAG: alpha/beta hydrolase family protein [Amphiamblys sp. WSBS2006]